MGETRKLAAILVSDVVGYSRLTGADEDRILARLRALRSDLIDPTIAVHHGRVVKRTGDGSIVEFRSVVDAVNCAIEVQRAMVERNAEVAPDKPSSCPRCWREIRTRRSSSSAFITLGTVTHDPFRGRACCPLSLLSTRTRLCKTSANRASVAIRTSDAPIRRRGKQGACVHKVG